MGKIENFRNFFCAEDLFLQKSPKNHDFGRLFGRPPDFSTGLPPPPKSRPDLLRGVRPPPQNISVLQKITKPWNSIRHFVVHESRTKPVVVAEEWHLHPERWCDRIERNFWEWFLEAIFFVKIPSDFLTGTYSYVGFLDKKLKMPRRYQLFQSSANNLTFL